jgi:hypothetical protein
MLFVGQSRAESAAAQNRLGVKARGQKRLGGLLGKMGT